MKSLLELKDLASKARGAVLAYEANDDDSEEEQLLFAMETAEQELADGAVYSKALMQIFDIIDSAIALADKAGSDLYKGQAYEIGRAKREVGSWLAAEFRELLLPTPPPEGKE